MDNFLTFYTDSDILWNYFCEYRLDVVYTVAQVILVAVSN
jgi:hypothetical protein